MSKKLSQQRSAAGKTGGKKTSSQRVVKPRGVDAASGYISEELYREHHEENYYDYRGRAGDTVYGGGDPEDEGRLVHYAAKNSRSIDTPGYSTAESMNAYFNAGRAEQEREWVSISDGEMLAYLEETVGGFRVGLGWPGTYRWSERAIVRRHVKGIPPESYPEEE